MWLHSLRQEGKRKMEGVSFGLVIVVILVVMIVLCSQLPSVLTGLVPIRYATSSSLVY